MRFTWKPILIIIVVWSSKSESTVSRVRSRKLIRWSSPTLSPERASFRVYRGIDPFTNQQGNFPIIFSCIVVICRESQKIFTIIRLIEIYSTESLMWPQMCSNKMITVNNLNLIIWKKSHFGNRLELLERPHRCVSCTASFKKSSHLKQHERRHTGDKPFHCKRCNKYDSLHFINIFLFSFANFFVTIIVIH